MDHPTRSLVPVDERKRGWKLPVNDCSSATILHNQLGSYYSCWMDDMPFLALHKHSAARRLCSMQMPGIITNYPAAAFERELSVCGSLILHSALLLARAGERKRAHLSARLDCFHGEYRPDLLCEWCGKQKTMTVRGGAPKPLFNAADHIGVAVSGAAA